MLSGWGAGTTGTTRHDVEIWAGDACGDGGGVTRGPGDGGGRGHVGDGDGQGNVHALSLALAKLLHTSGLAMCVGRRVPRLGPG